MRKKKPVIALFTLFFNTVVTVSVYAYQAGPEFRYSLSFSEADMHTYHVDFSIRGTERDTMELKMPQWMPGYYQIMNYADDLRDLSARDADGEELPITRTGSNSWQLPGTAGKDVVISYDINTHRRFVANSYTDSAHAYILPANTFLYPEGHLDEPVVVHITSREGWDHIATGLKMLPGTRDQFYAPDYDILYDCPLLAGNLEVLPSFFVEGVEHCFIAYEPGNFDYQTFMKDLALIVQTAVDMFGEVPYDSYTFIGLGKGLGGIEHLNNTTISFHGSSLATGESRKRVLAFIAHEYFHHFNVKRIRPFELGPFDYDRENRTNQLWISEGLTVYYEYLLLRRAGLISDVELLDFLAGDIIAYENDHGKDDQSLREASFYTWEEGPFGTRGGEDDRSISYYEKGCIIGLLLDFQIRSATQNEHSLDDVMRLLYQKYYKELQRGFTGAEFQHACESIAGMNLAKLFGYVYSTEEIDYQAYLELAGLQLENLQADPDLPSDGITYVLTRKDFTDQLQREIYQSWQKIIGEK
jgi:predicted metalloprotease with PDZ domain